jgi:hypothetical protein
VATEEIWVGAVALKRPSARASHDHPRTTAYATIVARAKSRFSYRAQVVALAKSRGWRLESVLVAEPLEKWLSPIPDDELDEGEPSDPIENAKEEAELRSLASAVAVDGVARSHDWDEAPTEDQLPRSLDERWGERLWLLLWWVGVPIFMIFIFPLLVQDVGPAYRAEFGHGTPGVFTATARECGKSCSSTGDWVANDGGRNRHHVTLASGAGAPHPGETRKAIDVGDRISVYPENGGWDWLFITFIGTLCSGVSMLWLYILWRRVRER